MKPKILITGIGGFIGFHLSKRLISMGYKIIGIDNLNNYYDPNLKKSRIKKLQTISEITSNSFEFYISNLESINKIEEIFKIIRDGFKISFVIFIDQKFEFLS